MDEGNQMIERVAKAMWFEARGYDPSRAAKLWDEHPDADFDNGYEYPEPRLGRDSYRSLARAAIEAIRDFDFASSDLWEFPLAYSDGHGGFNPPWKDIFDAALTPPPSGQEM